jgi:hypothetical protein
VPTIFAVLVMVGTLRFAHPTKLRNKKSYLHRG